MRECGIIQLLTRLFHYLVDLAGLPSLIRPARGDAVWSEERDGLRVREKMGPGKMGLAGQ